MSTRVVIRRPEYLNPTKVLRYDQLPDWIKQKIRDDKVLKMLQDMEDQNYLLGVFYIISPFETLGKTLNEYESISFGFIEELLGVSKAYQLPDWLTTSIDWGRALETLWEQGDIEYFEKIVEYESEDGTKTYVHVLVIFYDPSASAEYLDRVLDDLRG